MVGDNIVITILKVKGQTVRIGIEAPLEVRVLRGELAGQPPVGVRNATVAVNTGAPNYIGHQEGPD